MNDALSGSLPAASWHSDALSEMLLIVPFLASLPELTVLTESWSECGALFSAVSVMTWLWEGMCGLHKQNNLVIPQGH